MNVDHSGTNGGTVLIVALRPPEDLSRFDGKGQARESSERKAFNRIYETVGCVKCFLHTHLHAPGRRAPFRSLGKGFAIVNPRLAANRSV